jgi:flagellar assembly protein FliH
MMNLSSNDPQNAFTGDDVESFLYQDTSGGQAVTNDGFTRGSTQGVKSKKADDVPRISETEISRLVLEARAEGLREGEKNAKAVLEAEAQETRKKLAQLLTEFQREREEYYSKVEAEVVKLALSIAAKILHREAQVDPMMVAGIVKVAVQKLQQNTKVSVRVRPEDVAKWQAFFSQNPNMQIIEDASLEPMGCVLETEAGSAVMSVDAQLQEIEKGFFDLLAQRPTAK